MSPSHYRANEPAKKPVKDPVLAMDEDLEANNGLEKNLTNTTLDSLSWHNLDVVVQDRQTKQPLSILTSNSGYAEAGSLLALMGPSGSGKDG